MFSVQSYSLIAALLLVTSPSAQNHDENMYNSSKHLHEGECYTWMYRVNDTNDSKACICGHSHKYDIICDSERKELYIIDGLAMTYDNKTQQVIAGHTIYGWIWKSTHSRDQVYRKVPLNVSKVNEYVCGLYHRAGQLCGACEVGYVQQVYAYDFHCRECTRSVLDGWTMFIITTFVPLTLFYIFAIVFKFNANSPAIHAYILAVQLFYSPQIIRYYSMQNLINRLAKTLIIPYGIWNFDFVSAFDLTFCIQLSTLQVLALGYVPPCYSLLLIVITYLTIELHSRGCKIIICIQKLFQKCTHCLKIKWQYKSSTIDVFATFLLLSYNRLLSTHFDMLVYTKPFDINGKVIGKYLYYDPTVPYFKKEHLPYGIVAVVLVALTTLLPFLLLLFYPMQWVQKCLNSSKLNWYGLRVFVDSFTGCYKDGTEPGTRDCRYFAAFFLLLRILTYVTLAVLPITCAIATNGTIIMLFMAIFVACQPYKAKFAIYNKVTSIMLVVMSAACMALLGLLLSKIKTVRYVTISYDILAVLAFLPQIYVVVLALRWLKNLICTPKLESIPLINSS